MARILWLECLHCGQEWQLGEMFRDLDTNILVCPEDGCRCEEFKIRSVDE